MKANPKLEIPAEVGVIDTYVQRLYSLAHTLAEVGLTPAGKEIHECASGIQTCMGEIYALVKQIE